MEADNDRMEAKTRDAVVIDLDEIRQRRKMATGLQELPDVQKVQSRSYWILFVLFVGAVWFYMRRG